MTDEKGALIKAREFMQEIADISYENMDINYEGTGPDSMMRCNTLANQALAELDAWIAEIKKDEFENAIESTREFFENEGWAYIKDVKLIYKATAHLMNGLKGK